MPKELWKVLSEEFWKIFRRNFGKNPGKKMLLLIPGNNSGTGMLQQLMDSDGVGILFEAEADTLVTAIQSEYGK